MVGYAPPNVAVLAICIRDSQFWLLGPDRQACLVCGGPPTHAVKIPVFGDEPPWVEQAADEVEIPPAEPVAIAVKCPSCDADVQLLVSEDSISVVPVSPGPPGDDPDVSGYVPREMAAAAQEDVTREPPEAAP